MVMQASYGATGAVLFFSVISMSAWADEPIALEEIVVTADPLGGNVTRPVTVLTSGDLNATRRNTIGDLVSQTPGVSTTDFGPNVGRPVIRGLTGARVKVMEDGIGSMDVSTISPDHGVSINPLFADQVEVFRGPATLLYGSGASGGLVNIINHRIPEVLPTQPDLELLGQYDTVANGKTGAARINAAFGDFAMHLDGMKRDTDNYEIPGFAEITPPPDAIEGELPNSDVETEEGAFGLAWIGNRGLLGLSVSHRDNNYGIPNGHGHEEAPGSDDEADHGAEGVRIDQSQTRLDIKGELDQPLPGIEQIKTRWGYNDHTHEELEPSGDIGTRLQNNEWEGRFEVLHLPVRDWHGALGMQYNHRDFNASGEEAFVPDVDLSAIGVFMLEQYQGEHWRLELGGRYEYQEAEDQETRRSADHHLFSLSAGMSRGLFSDVVLGLSFTHSQRAPSIEALFSNGPHLATDTFEIGDPDMKRERSNSIDMSFSSETGRLTWDLNLFVNFIDDYIFLRENDLNDDGLADRVDGDFIGNVDDVLTDENALLLISHAQQDAYFYGLEAKTDLTLFDNTAGSMNAGLWFDWVRGKLDRGDDLPRITPMRFGAKLNYQRKAWRFNTNLTHVFRQDRISSLETATDSYTLLGLGAEFTPASEIADLTLFARASNLLNQEARRHTSFLKDSAPLPGRSGLIGLRIRF